MEEFCASTTRGSKQYLAGTSAGHPASVECESSAGGYLVAQPCSSNSESVQRAEHAAVETWRFAALMLGSEAEALRLIESTVASVEIDPCADPSAAGSLVRERVLDEALAIMHRQDPASFSEFPASGPSSCLEDETAAPLSGAEIAELVSGSGRGRLREWLNRLSQAQRAVFVQRAVLGQDNAATARAINRFSRPAVWTPDAIGRLFRQALCSLASSLAQTVPATEG